MATVLTVAKGLLQPRLSRPPLTVAKSHITVAKDISDGLLGICDGRLPSQKTSFFVVYTMKFLNINQRNHSED